MVEKLVVGERLKLSSDVPDLMEWVRKRVGKRSKQRLDMVFLLLVAAELYILEAREEWSFNEPVDEAIAGVRSYARELARQVFDDAHSVNSES